MSNRVTLTVKLTAGKDDDLIDWIAALPKGRRQAHVKSLLRAAIQQDASEPDIEQRLAQIGLDTAWLRAALSEMPAWMEGLLSRIATMQSSEALSSTVKPARTGQLSAEGMGRREKRLARANW